MEQRVSVVTLGVADLERARRFYERGLGWTPSFANEEVVFFQAGPLVLSLFPLPALAADAGLTSGSPGIGGVALAHNVRDPREVGSVLAEAAAAGGTILKPARKASWGGYSGYFADPDGHPWEVAFNPGWALDEDGRVRLP